MAVSADRGGSERRGSERRRHEDVIHRRIGGVHPALRDGAGGRAPAHRRGDTVAGGGATEGSELLRLPGIQRHTLRTDDKLHRHARRRTGHVRRDLACDE